VSSFVEAVRKHQQDALLMSYTGANFGVHPSLGTQPDPDEAASLAHWGLLEGLDTTGKMIRLVDPMRATRFWEDPDLLVDANLQLDNARFNWSTFVELNSTGETFAREAPKYNQTSDELKALGSEPISLAGYFVALKKAPGISDVVPSLSQGGHVTQDSPLTEPYYPEDSPLTEPYYPELGSPLTSPHHGDTSEDLPSPNAESSLSEGLRRPPKRRFSDDDDPPAGGPPSKKGKEKGG
jgi:hypothetical protein